MSPTLDYKPADPGARRPTGRVAAVVAAVLFGAWGATVVWLALRWTREVEDYTAHTDGYRLSIKLASVAAVLLMGGAITAAVYAFRLKGNVTGKTSG